MCAYAGRRQSPDPTHEDQMNLQMGSGFTNLGYMIPILRFLYLSIIRVPYRGYLGATEVLGS